MAKTAPEIIAFHFGCDMRDVSDGKYQRYSSPSVYVVYSKAGDYWCCPTASQKPPREFKWSPVATYYGRTVYVAKESSE